MLLSSAVIYLEDYGRGVQPSCQRATAVIVGWFKGNMYNNHNKCHT
jgi:hypothetical protein